MVWSFLRKRRGRPVRHEDFNAVLDAVEDIGNNHAVTYGPSGEILLHGTGMGGVGRYTRTSGPQEDVHLRSGDASGSFALVEGQAASMATGNLSFDGTNWNLFDTGQNGFILYVGTDGLNVYTATAGTNPRTLTGPVTLTYNELALLVAPPHVRATHSVGQAVASGTLTRMAFDTETVDIGGWHSNTTNNFNFVVPTTGYYRYSAWNDWAGSSATERRIEVQLNGVAVSRAACQAGSTGYASLGTAFGCNCTAGDIFTVWVTQYTGVSLNTSVVYFEAEWVSSPS